MTPMRITFDAPGELMAELAREMGRGSTVFQSAVRVRRVEHPIESDSAVFTYALVVTAGVLNLAKNAGWILEFQAILGQEHYATDAGKRCRERLDEWVREISKNAKAIGIEVLPGKLEVM